MSCLRPLKVPNPALRGRLSRARLESLKVSNRALFLSEMAVLPPYVVVPCGRCYECRKKRASEWRSRLLLEHYYGNHRNAVFVTLTVSDEYLKDFEDDTAAMFRRFRDRYRKTYGKPFWWFTTELGENTGRFHLHGVIWDVPWYVTRYHNNAFFRMAKSLQKVWKYGYVWIGYFNEVTASYITKYMLKTELKSTDDKSKMIRLKIWNYKPRVFCSAGIGRAWSDFNANFIRSKVLQYDSDPRFVHINGFRYALPSYYRYRLTSCEERRASKYAYFRAATCFGSVVPRITMQIGSQVYDSFDSYRTALSRLSSQYFAFGLACDNVVSSFDIFDFKRNQFEFFNRYYAIINGTSSRHYFESCAELLQ